VYIWNVTETTEVVAMLKRLRPGLTIVLGGPEVSYEIEGQEITRLADYVVTGEADLAFAALCRDLLGGQRPVGKVIHSPVPDLGQVALPYDAYADEDVAHRVVYVEASRGCPFTCEFCLSSLDIPVRQFPLEPFLAGMDRLLARGVSQFKFVDRTFNLNLGVSRRILEFFLARQRPGLFVHFEMVPDRLPEALREVIAKFPAGSLQFEVGIQTFDEATAKNISRRQDYGRLADNFAFLRGQTGVHIHADLIVGLPGETVASFAAGFDRLVRLDPQEIQVGILKRLRGTPIVRHDAEWGMVYSPAPPYEIMANRLIDFATMQKLRRFAKYWDLVANSGNFAHSAARIWLGAESPFAAFMRWSEWLYGRIGRQHGIALARLSEMLIEFLIQELGQEPRAVAEDLWRDYCRGGRQDKPSFLKNYLPELSAIPSRQAVTTVPKRQARRLAGA
jgi:hypothetical protein